MSTPERISAAEMAGLTQRAVNRIFPEIADEPHDGAFEMTAPATGQRFRVTVTEVPGRPDRTGQELAEVQS